jgi:hypothetical protein
MTFADPPSAASKDGAIEAGIPPVSGGISGITFATFDIPFIPAGEKFVSFRALGYNVFSSFLPDSRSASFTFAFAFVCLLYPLMWFLYSRRWFLKL